MVRSRRPDHLRLLAATAPGSSATSNLDTGELNDGRRHPFTDVSSIAAAGNASLLAGSPTEPAALYRHDLTTAKTSADQALGTITVDPGYISSRPSRSSSRPSGGLAAHGFFYPPTQPGLRRPGRASGRRCSSSATAARPARPSTLIDLRSSSGPAAASPCSTSTTAAAPATAAPTASGCNGQLGHRRRRRLRQRRALPGRRRAIVDGDRLAIRGGSAGGYTTLAALTFRDVFKAGAQLLRHQRPRERWRTTPTSSSRATSTA